MQAGTIFKGSEIVALVKPTITQKTLPKAETALDMLKHRAFRVAIGGSKEDAEKIAQELSLLLETDKWEMRHFLRVKHNGIFSKAVERIRAMHPNLHVDPIVALIRVEYGTLRKIGNIGKDEMERIDSLLEKEKVEMTIEKGNFRFERMNGMIEVRLEVPYVQIRDGAEMEADRAKLEKSCRIANMARARLERSRILAYALKAEEKDTDSLYYNSGRQSAAHGTDRVMMDIFSLLKAKLKKMNEAG